tara:strand:+ start:56 stop:559 length:504 start_codon:yes stop_codon:yes gene_type:complete
MREVKRPPEYRIYKPYKEDSGAASSFQLKITNDSDAPSGRQRKVELFWVSCQQTGVNKETKNASFGWDDSTKSATMKLGLVDVGELLLFLEGKKEDVSLFHQNRSGNTVVKMKKAQNKSGPVISFQMSSKREGNPLVKISHYISMGESQIILQLLKDFVSVYHNWKL